MKKQKRVLLITVLCVIALMGIVYAAFTSLTLKVNTTATASASIFSVGFDDVSPFTGVTAGKLDTIIVNAPTPTEGDLVVDFSVSGLKEPGDTAHARYKIINNGDVDACEITCQIGPAIEGENDWSEEYTFGPDENDILEILAAFERELGEKLQESQNEIQKVKYYETFDINGINFKNIFTTTQKNAEGNVTYHVYCGGASNEIISIDSEGKVDIKNPELEKYLGEIDLEQLIEENEKIPGKLKGISEKAEPEEMKNALDGESGKQKTEQEEEQEDEETQEIEQDLEEQGEDLEISKYRKIKDNHISERMPEAFRDGEENGIAFSNKLNRFVIISKVNGHYQLNENIEPARMTWKTIISIDPDGQKVERKVPHALMKLPNNPKKEVAVALDEYGTPSIETIDVLPCQERIARSVREEGEGLEKEENLDTRQYFEKGGKEIKHDIAHQVQEIEKAQKEENKTVDYDITPDDYIPNTEITWGQLMEDTGESLPKLIERYNKEMSKEGADSKDVVETIEYDYGNVAHEHRRGTN